MTNRTLRQQTCEVELGPYEPNIGTMLQERAKRFQDQHMILERETNSEDFVGYSWKDSFHSIQTCATRLLDLGIKAGDRIAILSENRREMLLLSQAVYSIGAISVPIFFGYFPEQVHYILEHCGARFLVVADGNQLKKVSEKTRLPELEGIFIINPGEDPFPESFKGHPVDLFKDLLEGDPDSVKWSKCLSAVKPDDSCLIMYTSGTTGLPKGVELSHRNILSQHKGISQLWKVGPKDRFLGYLPWHHCFGGIFETFMALYNGVPFAIDGSRGKDLDLLIENWKRIRPTLYFSVPMIYQLLLTEMQQDSKLKEVIFHPELRCVFTAAAPLPPSIYQIFKNHGIQVHEGWGLTEATPDITITRMGEDCEPGNVGRVLPGVEIRLNEEGEILAKGPNIMKRYYKNPKSTEKVLDEDGWLHTGDLGEIREDGLRIVGRADGVFKLVNGEKVPSAHCEGQLISHSNFVDRAVVVGRGFDYVTAIIFCNPDKLSKWASEKGLSCSDFKELLEHQATRALLQEDVRKANLHMDAKYYRIRKFYLAPNPPTLERGELTPTNKVCRQKVMERYEHIITEMYHSKAIGPDRKFVTA